MSDGLNRYRKPKEKIVIPDRVAERAGTKYLEDEHGCFISTYSIGSHGYAQIGWSDGDYRQAVTAHRAAWVYDSTAQIPEGMTIDHLCGVRTCVNPLHLRCVSNFENARRTFGRDWKMGECVNGHSNSELVMNCRGRYECRICRNEWQRKYRRSLRNKGDTI